MEKEYISALDAAKALKMSPGRFANLLRKERERLPVEIDRDALDLNPGAIFASHALARFYKGEPASDGILWALKIHRSDWVEFLSGWEEEHVPIEPLRRELETAQTRIAELEAELAACREQLAEARMLADAAGNEQDIPYTLWREVLAMRKEGKTEEEIAATLYDNKQWCSIAQVGALLHRGGRVTTASMLKHGQRLLGKA